MARRKTTLNISTFVGGLITEASPLSFPADGAVDILNCDVLPTAEIVRRLGVDFEDSYSLSSDTFTDTELETMAISTKVWKSVGGKGARQYLVLQIGSTVYFYNTANEPLSSGAKSFTIDLDSYLAPAATDASTFKIDATSGRGFLYIVSEAINPLRVEYLESTDTISVEEIEFKVRDLEGVDDGLEVDEEPATLSNEHKYNLRNQGWVSGSHDPIKAFYSQVAKSATGVYPSNSQVPWTVKLTDPPYATKNVGKVDAKTLRNIPLTTTEAAKGRYILNPFHRDRSTVSGIAGLGTVTTNSRPTAVAFFSGRAAYAGLTDGPHSGDVFISQFVNADASNAGKCYQAGDPTSEDDSALVATDGLVVPIPEAGSIVGLMSLGSALIVLATNGVWAITGTEAAGFKATGFEVSRIAGIEAGCLSRDSIIDIGGSPAWMGRTGIYGTQIDEVSLQPTVGSLTDTTIKTFYKNINDIDKSNAVGVFDSVEKKAYWFYKDQDTAPVSANNNYFEKVLVLNTQTGAWLPHTISPISGETPYIVGAYPTPQVADVLISDPVTVSGVQVTEQSNDVTIVSDQPARSTYLTGFVIMVPNSGNANNNFTFGQFLNTDFMDWKTYDGTGVDYSSYIEAGYYTLDEPAKVKQAPYLVTFMRRTETGFIADPGGGDGYTFVNPSSCLARAKWEWTDISGSNRWSDTEQVYKFDRNFVVDPVELDFDNGFPINVSKIKLPGKGRALVVRYESEQGNDFKILGWTIDYEGMTNV